MCYSKTNKKISGPVYNLEQNDCLFKNETSCCSLYLFAALRGNCEIIRPSGLGITNFFIITFSIETTRKDSGGSVGSFNEERNIK